MIVFLRLLARLWTRRREGRFTLVASAAVPSAAALYSFLRAAGDPDRLADGALLEIWLARPYLHSLQLAVAVATANLLLATIQGERDSGRARLLRVAGIDGGRLLLSLLGFAVLAGAVLSLAGALPLYTAAAMTPLKASALHPWLCVTLSVGFASGTLGILAGLALPRLPALVVGNAGSLLLAMVSFLTDRQAATASLILLAAGGAWTAGLLVIGLLWARVGPRVWG